MGEMRTKHIIGNKNKINEDSSKKYLYFSMVPCFDKPGKHPFTHANWGIFISL